MVTQNEAWRIIGVIDDRIKKMLGRGTVLEHTYGTVGTVTGQYAAVSLGADTNYSAGFRIPPRMFLQVGDRVRVSIDPRGDRWIDEVITPTNYPKATFDAVRGAIRLGNGIIAPAPGASGAVMTSTGTGAQWSTSLSMAGAIDASGNIHSGGDITSDSTVTGVTLTSTAGTNVGGNLSVDVDADVTGALSVGSFHSFGTTGLDGAVTVGTGVAGMVLKLNTERAWQFEQSGTGAAAILQLRTTVGAKSFQIAGSDGTVAWKITANDSGTPSVVAVTGNVNVTGPLTVTGAVQGTTLAIGTNKVARYVPLATKLAVFNAATTTVDITQAHTADIGTIPTNALAVAVLLIGRHSASAPNARLRVYDYGATGNNLTEVEAYVAGNYVARNVHFVKLGGTNNRQLDYDVSLGAVAGTYTYYLYVIGYWTEN